MTSVVIYLPEHAHLKGHKSASLQQKLVMLSRTRCTSNLFFLCADDYDFDSFLRKLEVPPDLAAEWQRLQALSEATHVVAMRESWWDALVVRHCAPPPIPARGTKRTRRRLVMGDDAR